LDRKEIFNKVCKDMGLKSIFLSKITVLRRTTNQDLENWLQYAHKNSKSK
jgi:hypothetical protein